MKRNSGNTADHTLRGQLAVYFPNIAHRQSLEKARERKNAAAQKAAQNSNPERVTEMA